MLIVSLNKIKSGTAFYTFSDLKCFASYKWPDSHTCMRSHLTAVFLKVYKENPVSYRYMVEEESTCDNFFR